MSQQFDIAPHERVLITGGTGSLGHALVEALTKQHPEHLLRLLSRDEKKQYDMRRRWPHLDYQLGDIRDPHAVARAVRDVQVVIHGASLKYVDVSEVQPTEYITTNVLGTLNLIAAIEHEGGVRRCVGISSDKACRSVNSYGHTKALLEKVFIESHLHRGERSETVYTVCRYGNVVGTRGSVIPFWSQCRKENRALPLTDGTMTRFFFTLPEALDLIACALRVPGGTIVSLPMRACTLRDLAEAMATEAGIVERGKRPGEKVHEELLSADEMARVQLVDDETGQKFFYRPLDQAQAEPREAYTSQTAPRLDGDQLRALVKEWL